jgi:hypothetical protein
MSGHRSSDLDDVEYSSDEAGFEEEGLSESNESRGLEENSSEFEEALDDGDAQYDNVDASDNHGDVSCAEDDHAYDADTWENEDLSLRQQHQHPAPPRARISIPPAVVDDAISKHATSVLALAAFDVFLLSLL